MGALISFFAGGPARIQALLIAALAMALVCAGLLVYGLWWRGEAMSARVELTAAIAQGTVLAASVEACSAGVELAKRTGEAAIAGTAALLEAARKLSAGRSPVIRKLEELIAAQRQAGEGCDWAWDRIEAEKRKAGAAR